MTMHLGYFSYLFVVSTLLCSASCRNTGQLDLHTQLRRALPVSKYPQCLDKPECQTQPAICNDDPDLAVVLCPSMCGGCVCEDNAATEGSCPALVPDVCEGELAVSLCPKTCGLCDQIPPTCFDHIIGLSCAELPDPCNDPLGMIACPKFCGLCKNETTTMSTTTTTPTTTSTTPPTTPTTTLTIPTTPKTTTEKTTPTSPSTTTAKVTDSTQAADPCSFNPCLNGGVCASDPNTAIGYVCTCPDDYSGWICQIRPTTTAATVSTAFPPTPADGCIITSNKYNLSCTPSEIVFMVEYARNDAYSDGVDHEMDFVRELVDAWSLQSRGIRVGVVTYHDTVEEVIHITDFKNDISGLKNRINELSRSLKPSGSADLGKALDFVRNNSFVNARPDAEKIVVPIVHEMNSNTKNKIVPAAQRLKNECVAIVGLSVSSRSIDWDIMSEFVSQPYSRFYTGFRNYNDLENAARYVNWVNAPCKSS